MIGLFKAIRDYETRQEHPLQALPNCVSQGRCTAAIEASQRKKHLPLNSYVSLSDENESDHLEGPGQKIRKHLLLIRKVQELWNARSRKF